MLLICAVHTVTFGHSRYHLPLIPIVLLYAAAALLRARELWAHRRRRSFLLACLLCAGLSLSWLWEILVLAGDYYLNALQGLRG
jgi:hypothetical protein